jgi:hypothetical protein
MKINKIITVFCVTSVLFCCHKEEDGLQRSFYMGFTPFPYAISQEAVDYTYNKIAENADIVNHHFDNGVPWVEALTNSEFHANIMNDWSYRKSATPAGKKIYVSVAPLNLLRTGLAYYRNEQDDMPLPSPWNSYNFSHEEVKTAYLNYCKRIIDFFKPDYFNMAIEANLLYVQKPDLWSDFLAFHAFIFQSLKQAYPELPIFSSVSGAYLLKGYFDNNDYVQQRLAVLQILENSDLYALSFYPYLSNYAGNPYPSDSFEELFKITSKPIAIAETGYAAQTFAIDNGAGPVTISSDEDKQNKYIGDLLSACSKHHAVFVINFVLRDYDALWQAIGAKDDLTIAWRDTGLYDENGMERPALSTWRSYFKRKVKP